MFEQEQNKNFITGFSGKCYILSTFGRISNIPHYENIYHSLRSCYKAVSTKTFQSAPIDM